MQALHFDIGDYVELGTDTKYKITGTVTGLAKPPIRTSSGNFAGRDGGYVSSQYYEPRVITIPGTYLGVSCDDAEALRAALNAVPIRVLIPITITTFTGQKYQTEGYLYDLKNDLSDPQLGDYQVLIVCPDPYLYLGEGEDGWIEQEFYKVGGGGYPTPYTLPVTWSPGQTPAQIANDGDIYFYPQLVLDGQYTNPKITNETTGAFIKLNVSTVAGQQIIIDMNKRTITLDGGSVAAYKTSDSSWWALQPGNNVVVLTTDSGSDEDSGIIRFRPGVEGI